MVSCCWWRTSGMRSSNGSRLSFSSQRSSLRIAALRPSSAKRRDSRSIRAAMPNFWANRRSSPTDAARSFKSTKCALMRRSAKKRSAARVSALLRMPNICTSTAPNIFPATMSPRSKIIAAAVLFSTGGAAIKWCGFGAWQLAAARATIAMLTILVSLPEARRAWRWRTVIVGFAYAATTLLYVQANKHTTAASAIFLQSTSPLFILLLAPLLLSEHATRRDIAQMAAMAVGLGLFFLGSDRPSTTAPNPALGNTLAAICAVTWAFTVIGYRWLAARGASVAGAAASGNLMASLFALVLAQPLVAGRPVDWAVVAFLGIFQLGIPYLFLASAVPRLRALEVA